MSYQESKQIERLHNFAMSKKSNITISEMQFFGYVQDSHIEPLYYRYDVEFVQGIFCTDVNIKLVLRDSLQIIHSKKVDNVNLFSYLD